MTGAAAQDGPELANQYLDDEILRAFLAWRLPGETIRAVEPGLERLGERARDDLLGHARDAEASPPRLVQFDAWGRRIDRIEVSPGWRALERAAAEEGIVATAYERQHGPGSRLVQAALLYLYHPSSAYFSCPLAMTDGAARLIELYGAGELRSSVLERLTTRDPSRFWTSGQWMTEQAGGSDVSGTLTAAATDPETGFRLHGLKWFTSATTSQMAMTLARIEGDPPGNRGLSLFFLRTRNARGELDRIRIHRLKDKLGTRALPTAELSLEGTPAVLIGERGRGVRTIASLLNVTRLYNATCAVASMRRALALARDYSRRRRAFGRLLADLPLHRRTLEELSASLWGNLFLTFHAMALQGREECGVADAGERLLLRLLTPVAKLFTAKQAIAGVSEALECLGGAGYVEDVGMAVLARDTQVLSIWEGTTNVLSLDVLRALDQEGAAGPLAADLAARLARIRDPRWSDARRRIETGFDALRREIESAGAEERQGEARRWSFRIARTMAATLLLEYFDTHPAPAGQRILDYWL